MSRIDLNKIVEDVLREYVKAIEECPRGKPWKVADDLLSNALGIRITASLIGGKWEIESVELTDATGGPNIYVTLEPDRITVDVCWSSQHARKTAYVDAREIFDYIVERLKETAPID